jgi:hypothetical protein
MLILTLTLTVSKVKGVLPNLLYQIYIYYTYPYPCAHAHAHY